MKIKIPKVKLPVKATRALSKAKIKAIKHAPEGFAIAGTIGVVVSGVLACKATLKAPAVLDEMHEQLEKVEQASQECDEETYSEKDKKNDTFIIYTQTAVKMVKLYAPSVILGGLSLTALLTSNNILRKRNITLAAAYSTLAEGFKNYRENVVDRYGHEVDKELRAGVKAREIEVTTTDDEGNEETSVQIVNAADPTRYSDYARFFDESCKGWTKDPEFNLMFLRRQQASANEMLKSRGYLFLNDVYALVGIPKTKAGQAVGWIYDEKHPSGDNCVDFGIYQLDIEKNRDFVNGYERSILLDFNVDGNILDTFQCMELREW